MTESTEEFLDKLKNCTGAMFKSETEYMAWAVELIKARDLAIEQRAALSTLNRFERYVRRVDLPWAITQPILEQLNSFRAMLEAK